MRALPAKRDRSVCIEGGIHPDSDALLSEMEKREVELTIELLGIRAAASNIRHEKAWTHLLRAGLLPTPSNPKPVAWAKFSDSPGRVIVEEFGWDKGRHNSTIKLRLYLADGSRPQKTIRSFCESYALLLGPVEEQE